MNALPRVINQHVILELIGPDGSVPMEAELRYDPFDPYAVAMVFLMEGHEVVWTFGRDLLIRGTYQPVGDGDVQVFPSLNPDGHAVVVLELTSPSGQALVEARTRDLLDFLARTTVVVWPGTESEHLRVDDTIAAILIDD